jgi:hypothetical protein
MSDDDLPPLPPYPPLIHRDRAAAHLRAIEQGLADGHVEWSMAGVAWLAQEFERDCAMLEQHKIQLQHFQEGTTYVPH